MRVCGIDLGSRMIKLVVIDQLDQIVETRILPTAFDPLGQSQKLLEGLEFDAIQATGYGRHLFTKVHGNAEQVSEIIAHAAGAAFWAPEAKAVLDIGGQDTKAISLGDGGKVLKFEMNDRCAAGTGKFLEVMATTFGMSLEEFIRAALKGDHPAQITSMCTVFAESEATSLIARGVQPADIALGLHVSMAKRSVSMLRRVTLSSPVVFTGGVAQNTCMKGLLSRELKTAVIAPEYSQFAGALGAALLIKKKI